MQLVRSSRIAAPLIGIAMACPAAAQGPKGPVISTPADVGPATTEPGPDLGLGRRIPIGAYGEVHLVHQGDATEANLRRFVVFLGHDFTGWARLYSEIEIEDGHEIEMEQAYLELSPYPFLGVRAGLVLIPLGITNLFHEPPTFNGVDRPAVDQIILPSTWRELGAGVFGELAEGLHYQLYLVNGLNAAKFSADRGIGPGRGQGVEAHSEDAAGTGRINFDRVLGLDIGAGFYFGGAGQDTDALGGVKVGIVEADARFSRSGLLLRAEYARVFIDGADRITDFLRETDPTAPAIGSAEQGFYAEAGYDVLRLLRGTEQEIVPFVRYENLNPRASLPAVLAPGPSEAQQFVTAGLTYRPHPQIVFKFDYRRSIESDEEGDEGETGANRYSLGAGFMF
jgi:hypothetical protein